MTGSLQTYVGRRGQQVEGIVLIMDTLSKHLYKYHSHRRGGEHVFI